MADVSLNGIEFTIKGSSDAASKSVQLLTARLDKLNTTLAKTHSLSNLSVHLTQVGNSARTAAKKTGEFASSIMRIAKYRIIRGVLKSITSAFQEGLKNAYQFSKINGGELAASLDLLATKSLTMKNQLGASFGALITAVAPIIVELINLVTRLANVLTMLFSALGGQSQYKKAKDVWTDWGEAAGGAGKAAKEAMKYLAPFDELNRLPDNSDRSGGGGTSTPDYSEMFEYEELPEWLQNFAAKMKDLASSLKITFNDVFFDWDDLTGEQIAEKVIAGLGAILGAGIGFMIGGVPGAVVGTLVGTAIALEVSSLIFDHDGVLSKNEIADMIGLALSGLCGGIVGFIAGGPAGALIGATVGVGIWAALKEAEFFSDGKVGDLTGQFANVMTVFAGGAIGFVVGGPAGALLGASIGVGVSLMLENFVFGDTSGWSTGDWIKNIVAVLAPIAGAGIGLVVGGPAGALIGMTIGLGISFALKSETVGGAENTGNALGERIKSGMEKVFASVQLMKTWAQKNILDKVQSAIDKGKEVVVTVKSKISEWKDSLNTWLNGLKSDSDASFNVTAVVNNLVDAIPVAKKKIADMVANFKDKIDNIPVVKKIIDNMKSKFTTTQDSIPQASKVINGMKSVFNTFKDSIPSASKVISGVKATLNTWENKLSGVWTNTKATLNSWENKLSGVWTNAKATLNTWENRLSGVWSNAKATFNTWVSNIGTPSINSRANITSYSDGIYGTPSINSSAYFTSYSDGIYGTPDVNSTANLIDAVDNIPYTPTINVTGNITDWHEDSRGYPHSYAKGGAFYGGGWHNIPQAAGGGNFHGSLFWAGEKGPEIVGHAGGRTEVLNRSQLASTMYSSVVSAMSRALNSLAFSVAAPSLAGYGNAGESAANEETLYTAFLRALNDSNSDEVIELDGDVVYKKMVQRNRQNTRRTGVNAMMAT